MSISYLQTCQKQIKNHIKCYNFRSNFAVVRFSPNNSLILSFQMPISEYGASLSRLKTFSYFLQTLIVTLLFHYNKRSIWFIRPKNDVEQMKRRSVHTFSPKLFFPFHLITFLYPLLLLLLFSLILSLSSITLTYSIQISSQIVSSTLLLPYFIQLLLFLFIFSHFLLLFSNLSISFISQSSLRTQITKLPNKTWQTLIKHHKGDDGVAARWIKLLLLLFSLILFLRTSALCFFLNPVNFFCLE